MRKRGKLLVLSIIILALIIGVFLIRAFSAKQLDDVSPEILCSQELLEKADVLYIIPAYYHQNISENQEWCQSIIALNKKLALHGVYHTPKEFSIDRNTEYLQQGIREFENCFNQTPEKFKSPQLATSKSNKKLIKNNNLKLEGLFNQVFHKVYHCDDKGEFPNWLIDLF
ncbi:MAG: hypothetical protein ABIE22_02910 [archaeon]